MRRLIPLLLCCFTAGCDPAPIFNMALAPQPALPSSVVRDSAFDLAARVARQHGLVAAQDDNTPGLYECHWRDHLSLCVKSIDTYVAFRMVEPMRPRWSAYADSVRRELVDSLRARYGADAVRNCRIRLTGKPREFTCSPLDPLRSG